MLRRSHILTSAALLAISVVPSSAFAMPDQPVADQPVPPPPSSIAISAGAAYDDLRSPDARDAGPASPAVQQPVVEIREVPSNGFDWGDAGIGAAGILAMFSIAAGFTLLVGSRRRRDGLKAAH
jgi:hypothetical protein